MYTWEVHPMKEEVRKAVREELRLRWKLHVLDYAHACGNVSGEYRSRINRMRSQYLFA